MKSLLRLSNLVMPLVPVMLIAVITGTLGFFCSISIPVLAAGALFHSFPVRLLLVCGVLRGILHYIEQYCNHYIAFKTLARIRDKVFSKLRYLGPAKTESKEKGSMISLLTSDIELLEVFFAHTISPVLIAVCVTLGMCLFFYQINPYLALIALAFYVVTGFAFPVLINKSAVKHASVYRNDIAQMNSFLIDCLRGLSVTIMYGRGQKKLESIENKSGELLNSQRKMSLIEGLTYSFSSLLVTLGSLSMLYASLYLCQKGVVTHEGAVICTVAMFSSFGAVLAASKLGSGLSQTMAGADRVMKLLDEKCIVEEVHNERWVHFNGAELKSVSFAYGNSKVFEDLSLKLQKNKIIGIKGPSGCGKSTVLKLLMRFWDCNVGEVSVSGENIRNISTDNLRAVESYISQDTVLFHDTVLNNIRIAKLDATDEEIIEACKKANIHNLIASLPDRYNTMVDELGSNFSGGERQRLGLARAFLHKGDFILLDEPTSNLDSWNEREIMRSVKEESESKTVVIVSHRDSTFIYADEVINLESNRKS